MAWGKLLQSPLLCDIACAKQPAVFPLTPPVCGLCSEGGRRQTLPVTIIVCTKQPAVFPLTPAVCGLCSEGGWRQTLPVTIIVCTKQLAGDPLTCSRRTAAAVRERMRIRPR